mmetsp:Transcript_42189/g.82777  ORF Transcript_42189/g.82777 Transcript_42189/m.82777 type:complete len:235 (-) Transcript_42189:205-909(-)
MVDTVVVPIMAAAAADHGKFHCFRRILTALTRTVALVYAAAAVYAIIETRILLSNSEPILEDDVLFLPLLLCTPSSYYVDGTKISIEVEEGYGGCQKMDFLINSCAVGLLFSVIASVFFVVVDLMARRKWGPFNTSSATGMGVFLFFILVQTGISTGALVEQIQYYVKFQETFVGSSGFSYNVKSFADTKILLAAVGLSFGTAILIFIDCVLHLSLRYGRTGKELGNVRGEDVV